LTCTGENLPFRRDSFDAVILLNVLDHCLNPKQVIEEIHRIIKPGGILILSVDIYSKLINIAQKIRICLGIIRIYDELHPHRFTSLEVVRILKLKFEPLNISLSCLDPLSMGKKRAYPMESGIIAKIRGAYRMYFIGKKL